ncbi:MAG: adenylate/guanylate cyclase domain-containing protein [Saprospiraceae bacterium]
MSSQSTKFHLKLRKVIYITFAWLCISLFQVFYDYLIVISYTNDPTLFRLPAVLVSTILIAIIAGILGGFFIVNKVEPWLRSLPFWKALVLLFGFYTITGLILMTLGSFVFQSIVLEASVFDAIVMKEVQNFLTGLDFLKLFISWGLIFLGTIVLLMIYDKYGPGNFRNLLLGRYFHPRTEERIFMFLDIRSSTTIAERLGNEQYFRFIHDFINDATPPILYAQGEIYQYVGDEIVVSWTIPNGLANHNYLNCFFDIQAAIQAKSDYYLQTFGTIPEFKAGLHYGSVISGEIGTVKKEITFSGDVLNTASRIQSECNKHQLDLLLSDELVNLMPLPANYVPKSIGEISLRGKTEEVGLSTVVKQ